MTETYYAVLMTRKILDVGIYYYSPELIIEGEMITEDNITTFIDTMGNEYLTIHDAELCYSDLERGVGYIISKEDLLDKYPGVSLEESKSQYFEMICESSHFGFLIYQEEIIGIVPLNLKGILEKLNTVDHNEFSKNNSFIELEMSSIKQPGYNEFLQPLQGSEDDKNQEFDYIYMDIRLFEEILASKTYEEVMAKLNQIYPKSTSPKTYESGEEILNRFDQAYEEFIKIDSIDEIKVSIKELENYYIELIVKMDGMPAIYNTDKARNFIFTLVDAYDALLKINDLEQIRNGILKIKENSRKNLERIAKDYNPEVPRENIFASKTTEEKYEKTEPISEKIIDVKAMKAYFDQVIIGQDEAKKDVIAAIVMNKLSDDPHSKNSCLLVGPTGSGKTLIAETVSKYFNMPIEIVDTTQLTIPGYVGANIEDFLVRLLNKTGGDLKKAEEGIIVFDEIDKKGSKENGDVSGKGVLNTLLPFLQGTTYNLSYNGRTVPFNTKKLTVFATGAFTDVATSKLENKTTNGYGGTKMGFNSEVVAKDNEEDITYEKLEIEDFVKYGNMPIELIGRFSTIAQLSGHTKESLKTILTDSIISPLIQEQAKLAKANIFISWDDEYLDAVAAEALKLKTGARSLKTIVERTIKDARWEALLNLGLYREIRLSAKTVEDSYNCELVDINGNVVNLQDVISEEVTLKRKRKRKQG